MTSNTQKQQSAGHGAQRCLIHQICIYFIPTLLTVTLGLWALRARPPIAVIRMNNGWHHSVIKTLFMPPLLIISNY